MLINQFVNFCDSVFPFKNAIEGDKVGLQLINKRKVVKKVLFTLEITNEVVEEAKLLEIDTIISFHPLIFKGINLSIEERVENLVRELIINDINVLIIHTNFDTFEFGTNYLFAKKLSLNIIDYLIPLSNNSIESYGMGLICKPNISHITNLNQNNQLGYWVEKISSEINSPVKFTNNESGLVNNIAIICGSGSSFLDEIIKKNEKLSNEDKIDTFITADISYHTFHRCRGVINMIDVGHYEMEQFVPDGMYKIIKEKYENYTSNSNIIELDTQNKIKFYLSKVLTNPVDFYPNLNYKENQLNYLLNHYK